MGTLMSMSFMKDGRDSSSISKGGAFRPKYCWVA